MQQTPNLNLNKPDGTDIVDIADLNANMDIIDAKLGTTGHNHNGTAGNGPKITNSGLAAGAADDVAIGNRTVNQTLASPANTGTITQFLSWLAGRIKAITGASNWYDTPATTLAALNALFGVSGHSHNGVAGQGPKIEYGNLSGVPSTFTPSAHTHDDRYYTVTEANTLLAAKAPLASPSLIGVPTAPTAAVGTNTTQLATTAFVQAAINNPVVWDYTVPANVSTIALPQAVVDLLNADNTPFSILFHLNVVGASTVNHLYGIRPSTNGNSSYANISGAVYSDIRNGALSSLIIGHYDGAITRTWGSGLPGVCFMRSTVIRKNNTLNLAGLNVYHIPDVKTYDQPTLGQLFMNGTATSYTIGCYLGSGADSGGVITAGTRIIVKKEV